MSRKRRGRGEGSISQRTNGLWEAKISLGYDGESKRRRRTVYGKSKAEVQTKLRELQNSAANGILADATQLTMVQFLSRWLENTVRPKVNASTYERYEQQIRLYINPCLGGVKLTKLTPFHVEQLYASMERNGKSGIARQKVGKTLRQALRHAVNVGFIPSSPAEKVPLPKGKKAEMRIYDADQVRRFLNAAKSDRLYAMYVVALDSGMRQGELFALQWSDIDFKSSSVSVQRSLENVGDQLSVKETKSAKGRRRIELSEFTIRTLQEHQKRMLAEGHISGPVFCDTQGGWLRRSNFLRSSFKAIIERAKLPHIRFHDLRHTCASLLLLADVNVKVVSERLGHASIQLTLDTYSHVLPTMQRKAAEKMNAVFIQIAAQ
jgi:integrase